MRRLTYGFQHTVIRSSTIAAIIGAALFFARHAPAQEAEWIWSPEHKKEGVPLGACHFRKTFSVAAPERGQIVIAADDSYEVYLNGRRIGTGESARQLDRYDVTQYLRRGNNLVSVKVNNSNGRTAALVARIQVKQRGAGWTNHSTNSTWKTALRPLPLWNLAVYNDRSWAGAQSFGMLGRTEPWDRATGVKADQQENHERFKISREFKVQRVIDQKQSGSLICMTFNEFGQIIASREGGPLVLVSDSNKDKVPDKVSVYCDKVKSCQGILALNGEVFVTGDGPEGNALYRLADKDRDGKIESVQALLKFKGEVGEHGPHGITLGPDGMLYVIVGNHSAPATQYAATSPHRNFYEGDLSTPRYEDPGGHAVGIKAPGGVIFRMSLDGKTVELVAGGIRNAYDLAFNGKGDLFTHDSDMESDMGTTWYRPTKLFHVIPGGEYGWRSGWAKWPEYFVDSLPGILDTGRGSPTGVVVYDHFMFPKRFHGALFLGDWSEGRIIAVKMKRSGGSYKTNSEVFLQGEPLNVTDLEVGPEGALYFITGGRGTSGGLYRITWRGTVPDKIRNLGEGLTTVIRQPQIQSAWGRQKIAGLKIKLGDKWKPGLVGVATTEANPSYYRIRALNVMQLFGPLPSPELLVELSKDKNEEVRSKVAELMGLHANGDTHQALAELLQDSDRTVRRKACEALARADQTVPIENLEKLLTSDDRFEAWAARRLLERLPPGQWQQAILSTDDHRLFIQGATALLVAHPSKQNAIAVISRISTLVTDFVSDDDFIDLMRVAQIALHRGQVTPEEVPAFGAQLADEFPSGNSTMNRELARLLGYLQVSSIADRYISYINSDDVPDIDKLHVALHLRFVNSGWSSEQRMQLLQFYAKAVKWDGGGSYAHYVMNVSRDFAKSLDAQDVELVLANGASMPNAALGALYKLPERLDNKLVGHIKEMDRQLARRGDDGSKRLQVGVVAVLARSGDEDSLNYLREIWRRDPERRETVAMGLAQHPQGDNWDYLVRSLPILEDGAAREVLAKLTTVNLRPEEAEYYRHVILKGLKLKENGAAVANSLMQHWTGEQVSGETDTWEVAMAAWQKWYADEYPNEPAAVLPVVPQGNKWDYDELLEYISGEEGASGSAQRGAMVFTKAQCNKCHRYGGRGESMGPDLSTLSKRFTRKEILQSILFPSHVISDQYASKTIITSGGQQITGIVAAGANGEKIVLTKDGKKVIVKKSQVDEIIASKTSAMPAGLLNTLTQQEVADLFAYLGVAPKPRVASGKSTSPK